MYITVARGVCSAQSEWACTVAALAAEVEEDEVPEVATGAVVALASGTAATEAREGWRRAR
jgi:hypothetical protein